MPWARSWTTGRTWIRVGSPLNHFPCYPHDKRFTGLGLRDVQEKLQRESTNGTSLAQKVQQLESKLRSVTSRAEELEGSLAGSRSERERLSTTLRDTETGVSLIFSMDDASLVLPGLKR